MSKHYIIGLLSLLTLTACPPTETPTAPGSPNPTASPASPTATPTPGVPSATPSPTVSPSITPSNPPITNPDLQPSPTPTATANTPIVARLVANQGFYRLEKREDTLQMVIRAYDSRNNEIPLSQLNLEYVSSNPSHVSVNNSGLLTAENSSGSANIEITDPRSGISITVLSEVSASSSSGGGGGGGGGGSTTHNTTTSDVDYTDVEFEPEA